MENFSKVLRQLPEKPLKWFLQEFMKDGIPTKLKGHSHDTCVYPLELSLEDDCLFAKRKDGGDFLIYTLLLNEPQVQILDYQDPTTEQVKAIYEGVEEVECVFEEGDIGNIIVGSLHKESNNSFWVNQEEEEELLSLFIKGKGFALPISWKEEEEINVDCIQQTGRVIRYETPEPKEDKSEFISLIKDLQERVTKLEQIQYTPKEVESGDGEFRIGEIYTTKEGDVVFCTGKGKSSIYFSGFVISSTDNYWHIGQHDNDWLKRSFTPYTLPNKGEIV